MSNRVVLPVPKVRSILLNICPFGFDREFLLFVYDVGSLDMCTCFKFLIKVFFF